MTTILSATQLSDEELLADIKTLAARERQATSALVAALAELDSRRLYLGEGCSSLFTYCTQVLHLSEHAAYGRIEAARAARRCPVLLELLVDGSMTLTAICLLAPHLTPDNHRELLAAARHKSKREVEHLVATLRPQPAVPSSIRRLPTAKPSKTACHLSDASDRAPELPRPEPLNETVAPAATRPVVVAPLAPDQYKVQFTVSGETYQRLRRAQDLLRHTIPNGDPAAIFDRALRLLVAELERTKLAASQRPRAARSTASGSRHVPAAVKRAVWNRDGGQCAFVGTTGRCTETGFLEFHHKVPFAAGGATVTENLELRCTAHNAFEAKRYFGPLMLREEAGLFATRSGPSSALEPGR